MTVTPIGRVASSAFLSPVALICPITAQSLEGSNAESGSTEPSYKGIESRLILGNGNIEALCHEP